MAISHHTGVLWQLEGLLRRRALIAGLLKAAGRFLSLLGVLLLSAWSYSLWGSIDTPLRSLLIPGVVLLAGGWLLGVVLERTLRTLQGLLKHYLRGLEKARATRSVEEPK
jgi:hypothetical protein